jgi:hypothetical protein
MNELNVHHDALEFPNGEIVRLQKGPELMWTVDDDRASDVHQIRSALRRGNVESQSCLVFQFDQPHPAPRISGAGDRTRRRSTPARP